MSGNEIEELNESVFEKLRGLKSLDLASNKLMKVPSNILQNLPNLQNVSLENNRIKVIDPNLFSTNTKLVNIWLNNNKIKDINPKSFQNLIELEYLDLRGNDCVDQYYSESSLQDLKSDLARKCLQQALVIKGVTFRPDTKPSISWKVKPKIEDSKSLPREVACDLYYVDWSEGETLFTCTIKNVEINSPDDLIESTPYAPYVQAISFKDNRNVSELPKNIGKIFPKIIKFSAKNTSLTSLNPNIFHGLNEVKGKKLKLFA